MGISIDTSDLDRAIRQMSESVKRHRYFREIAMDIAKICRRELYNRTPKKTGKLSKGWFDSSGMRFYITSDGYRVELINPVEYGLAVNNGHYSHNQYNVGGTPYRVKPEHRTVPYYKGNNADTFVYGHFFVEKTVVALENDSRLADIIEAKLQEWFEECCNG